MLEMNAAEHNDSVEQERIMPLFNNLPSWMGQIAGAIECLSLGEAKDILELLIPNASVRITNKNSIIAVCKDLKYEIEAPDMLHEWSEDHSADKIVINCFYRKMKTLSKSYHLKSVKSVFGLVSECSFNF